MRERSYFIYIMASQSGTLYIGVTNNLERRAYEHKHNIIDGFTKQYSCHNLVYLEETSDVYSALSREKQLKKWRREKKEWLIKQLNPKWVDLSSRWSYAIPPSVDSVGMTIQNSIKTQRLEKNLTQEELAASANVSRQTIIAIEKGNYTPSLLLAMQLAKFFKVTVEDLFNIK